MARYMAVDHAIGHCESGPFALQTVLDKIDRWSKFIHDAEVADPAAGGE